MESFAGGTSPIPYFIMAFGLAGVGLFGYAAWTLKQRHKLRLLLAAVRNTGAPKQR